MHDADDQKSSSKSLRRIKNIPLLSRMSSRANSTFSPSDILPQDGYQPYPNRPESDLAGSTQNDGELVLGASTEAPASKEGSTSPPSVFDKGDQQDLETEPTTQDSDEPGAYDLKPPPPTVSPENIEALSGSFFSPEHLDYIIRDQNAGPRFVQFLNSYRSQYGTSLTHYIESKKALIAVEYANAIANHIPASHGEPRCIAATIDESFDDKSRQIAEELVEEALPAYLTHRLVSLVTDTLVKDITGNSMPVMKDLIPNLAEVYCITDPSLQDNPIVYASEEFYNTTQYGRGYVIGRNCRFLQGPKTSESTVRRMVDAIQAGEELCETIVNYRRDGTPFMNLLMIAPLYDNKGDVRYFLGCQIDVSPLIAGGKGLDSFAQLLSQHHPEQRSRHTERDPMSLLGELGQMLNEPETDFVMNRVGSTGQSSGRSTPQPAKRPSNRRYLSMDDSEEGKDKRRVGPLNLWPDSDLGHSGRLPGVYRNYLLVRPYPSLRITFTSPSLRIPGLLQTKFLDRIGGPDHLRDGILDAFKSGQGVTAKVPWLPTPGKGGNSNRQYVESGDGKPRWIHCTPMSGSDEKVGVWMVVLVENEEVTGQLNRQDTQRSQRSTQSKPRENGTGARSNAGNDLYADYLKDGRREGRPVTNGTTESARERREVDAQFRDF